MKRIYLVKLSFILVLSSLFYNSSLANFKTNANFEGDYENPSAWNLDQWPNTPPPIDGNVSAALEITSGAKITRNGDFNPVKVSVKGLFVVKGNYTNNQWDGIIIEKDGKLEIFGDLIGSAGITVKTGGVLVVHGNLSSTGSGITSHGDIIVVGNFSTSSNTTVHNKGNLIVGGDFSHAGGGFNINGNKKDTKVYILNPDAVITGPDWSVIQNPEMVGDLDDFQEDEPNSPLGDLVNEVVISVVLGSQWKSESDNSSWRLNTNWSGNKVPSATSNVKIKSAEFHPTILATDELVEVKNLIIEEGAVLTLKPGAQLTVNGMLTINDGGKLLLENEYGEGKMASLITHGEVEGKVETKLTLPPNQWFYIGSSRKEAVFSDFGAGNEGVIVNVYRAVKWWGIKSGLAGRALRPLEGIVTNYQSEDGDQDRVITYTGELNNAAVSRTFDESGYHLMANPYPSFINWEDTEAFERPTVDGTMWYRSKIGEEMVFVTYNRNAPSFAKVALSPFENMSLEIEKEFSLIPPMQAVWVKALEPGATLTVMPSARTHGEATSRLKSSGSGSSADVLRIQTDNKHARDGAVLYFIDGADDGFDKGDSEKYFNDSKNVSEIYTRVDDRALAINGMSLLKEDIKMIPLIIRNSEEGEVLLKFDLSYFTGQHTIYLEDRETGALVNLFHENEYSYSVTKTGEVDDRFVLHFYKVSTGIETPGEDEMDAGNDIKIKSIGDKVLVSMSSELLSSGNAYVEIYAINGRKVDTVPARSSRTLIFLPKERGVFVIRAVANNRVKSERVVNAVK
jgi:hypothetical protein